MGSGVAALEDVMRIGGIATAYRANQPASLNEEPVASPIGGWALTAEIIASSMVKEPEAALSRCLFDALSMA